MGPVVAVAVAMLFGSAALADPSHGPRSPSQRFIGRTPPPLELTRLSGSDPVTLSALRGRVVILDFWATWCRPCHEIARLLEALHRQHHGDGLTVLGITQESPRAVLASVRASSIDYTETLDHGRTMLHYGIHAIPTLVLIDRAGRVRDVTEGLSEPILDHVVHVVNDLLADRP